MQNPIAFLEGGGEMGSLIRHYDWEGSRLGRPERWPQPLRTVARLLLSSGHPIFIFWGPDHICLYNDSFVASLGPESHPAMLGQPGKAVWEDIWDIIGPQIDQVMSGGGATWHRNQLVPITRHGRREDVYWTYSYSPIDDDTAPNSIGGVLVICSETTADVVGLREAAAEAGRFNDMFRQAPAAIAVLRGETHVFETVNESYQDLIGHRDVLGKTVAQALPEVVGQGFIELLDEVYKSGEPHVGRNVARELQPAAEMPIRRRVLDFVYHPMRNAAAIVDGIFVQATDVTEWAKSDAALRESEARFRAAIDVVEGVLWTNNAEGQMTGEQPGWATLTGQSYDEYQNYGWSASLHPDDIESTMAAWQEAVRAKKLFAVEHRVKRADGTWRLYSVRALPALNGDGTVREWVGVHSDITDLRDLTQNLELRVAQEVAQRTQVEDALRQAQKMEAIGQLTGGVAHDFNNLLTVIRSATDLLKRPDLTDARKQRYLDAISETSERAAKLTSQLLSFARRQVLLPEVFDVSARVLGIAEMLQTLLGQGVRLDINVKFGDCFVEADAAQFDNALVNMAVNARDAMNGDGTFSIRVSCDERMRGRPGSLGKDKPFVAISVSDTGPGIAREDLQRIFEPFFTTKDIGRGTGLGLSQVYGFAKQSGGEIEALSEAGEGAKFTLYLPQVETPCRVQTPATAPAPIKLAKGHILVVEDNPQVGEFACQLLEQLGYTTTLTENGAQALAAIEQAASDFNIVFSDVMMPVMDGIMMGRRIRESWPQLPVVLTSGCKHSYNKHLPIENY